MRIEAACHWVLGEGQALADSGGSQFCPEAADGNDGGAARINYAVRILPVAGVEA